MPEELLEIEASDSSLRPVEALDAALGVGAGRVDASPSAVPARTFAGRSALLEKRLGELFASAFPRQGIEWTVGAVGGPRVLGVAELERVRDALAARLREAQAELGRRGEIEEQNRGLVEAMIAEPRALPVGAGVQRGRRRARLPPLAFPAALGHPRDAAWAGGGSSSPPAVR